MTRIVTFLTRTKGSADKAHRFGAQDYLAYGYLLLGVLIILIPVSWTLLSSIKSEEALSGFDTRLLPYSQIVKDIPGIGEKPIYTLTEDGQTQEVFKQGPTRRVTEVSPVANPETILEVPRTELKPSEEIRIATENYLNPLLQRGDQKYFNFNLLLWNTVFVTVTATLITLLINSMAAFALSKYRFRGRLTCTILIIATLLIPSTIILVSLFFVVWSFGIFGSLWGVIIPAAATPTGVFLLRQYMLTIPDELLEAARMDAASEWRIYWRIVLPLSLPALSVLAILSVIWRWNDFLWPLIVLISDPSQHTIQIGLTTFSGEFNTDQNYILAMTVVSLIPVTLVFVWLQRFITTGIATTGLK
ncbi:carbohydrate ABC transporter permease [Pseudoruegeria sp. SK021]|uniref:carbohydrate ABC transporter permease n=1 Tax=Pseudoruegeria sp. SK021 TaxID=1933035 RepID=UPI000A24BF11|nr:carbohydrate ABC transporter permease [Pseudoruegeria sp. SK021]OSP54702.1 ABC transporter permease [Pseudoruegeria sp. SK021]